MDLSEDEFWEDTDRSVLRCEQWLNSRLCGARVSGIKTTHYLSHVNNKNNIAHTEMVLLDKLWLHVRLKGYQLEDMRAFFLYAFSGNHEWVRTRQFRHIRHTLKKMEKIYSNTICGNTIVWGDKITLIKTDSTVRIIHKNRIINIKCAFYDWKEVDPPFIKYLD